MKIYVIGVPWFPCIDTGMSRMLPTVRQSRVLSRSVVAGSRFTAAATCTNQKKS